MQQSANNNNYKINVCARLRPIISEDYQRANVVKREPEVCVHCHKDGQSIKLLQDSFHHKQYRVDHTLDASATQVDAYNTALKSIVYDVLKGYNGTALVYGPTASGKTYTMFGNESKVGIAHFAVNDIFAAVSRCEEQELVAKVYISFYQIHVEQVYDLLTTTLSNNTASLVPLSIRDGGGQSVFVEGLQQYFVKDKDTAYDIIKQGLANRRVRSTSHNIRSSRSHAILQFHLDFEVTQQSLAAIIPAMPSTASTESRHILRRRVLTLVDLAGSERVPSYNKASQSASSSKQFLQEAIVINKSIAALGNVISALANNSHSIPYRESKLTRLLASSLDSSRSRVVIIVHINPCSYAFDESASTLKFATRAKLVREGSASSINVQPVREIMMTSEVLPYFQYADDQQAQTAGRGEDEDQQSFFNGVGREVTEEGTATDSSSIRLDMAAAIGSPPRFSSMMSRNMTMNFGYQQQASTSTSPPALSARQASGPRGTAKAVAVSSSPHHVAVASPIHRPASYNGPYPTPVAATVTNDQVLGEQGQGQGQGQQQFNLRDFLRACTIANRIAKADFNQDLNSMANLDESRQHPQQSQSLSSLLQQTRSITPFSPMAASGAVAVGVGGGVGVGEGADSLSPLKAMNGSNLSLLSAYSLPDQNLNLQQHNNINQELQEEGTQPQQQQQQLKESAQAEKETTTAVINEPLSYPHHILKAPVFLSVSTHSSKDYYEASKTPALIQANVEVQTMIIRSIDSDIQTEEILTSSQGTQTFALTPTPRRRFFDGSLNDFEAFVSKPVLDMTTQTNPALLVSSFYGRDEDQAELSALSQLDPLEVASLIIELRQKVRQQNEEIVRLQELVLY